MDTFAAIALASLPPDNSVMKEKPRKVNESIVSRKMALNIFAVGGVMTFLLLMILYKLEHASIQSMTDLFTQSIGSYNGLDRYEQSLFFTSFVMLQYWNMFNAKAFMTRKTAFNNFKHSRGFNTIAFVILSGQLLIVQLGYDMFNVKPMCAADWIIIIAGTSFVLWIGELLRTCRQIICKSN